MYVRRDCLKEVGGFDAGNFGKGYGEENDFCMRASYRGWRHRAAADVFVYHAGAVSFGWDAARLEQAGATMRRLHPSYEALVERHRQEDPLRRYRRRIDAARIAGDGPTMLYVAHVLGGGTERHLQYLVRRVEAEGIRTAVLRPCGGRCVCVEHRGIRRTPNLVFVLPEETVELLEVLRQINVRHVHLQHLQGVPEEVLKAAGRLGVPYDWTMHDYMVICPRLFLMDESHRYCGEPDAAACNRCIRAMKTPPVYPEIGAWRAA